jgi:hypothetical protein
VQREWERSEVREAAGVYRLERIASVTRCADAS